MQILRQVRDKSDGRIFVGLKWTGKNVEQFLQIAIRDARVSNVSEFTLCNWLFFPSVHGELLVRKGGWVVRVSGNIWVSVNGKDFKRDYDVIGDVECPEYADSEE